MLKRILLAPVEDWAGSLVLFLLLVLMGVNVFARYVLNTGIGWSEEISRYLLIWLVYLGIAAGIRNHSHVRIDLIDRLLGPRAHAVLAIVNAILLLGFLVALVWIYIDLIGRFARLRSPASQLSMAYAYGAVLVGALLGIFRMLTVWLLASPPGSTSEDRLR